MDQLMREQIALERVMLSRGQQRYIDSTHKNEEKGRGFETSYARRLTQGIIGALIEKIDDDIKHKKRGCNAKFLSLVKDVDPKVAAFVTLKVVFNSLTRSEKVQVIAGAVGTSLEDEQKLKIFQELYPKYYEYLLRSFKDKDCSNYRYMHRVLNKKARDKGIVWRKWTNIERVGVGSAMLDALLNVSDIISLKLIRKFNKTYKVIVPSDSCAEWIKEHMDLVSKMSPDMMPCLIKPLHWVNIYSGGYHTPIMQHRLPLIKSRQSLTKRVEDREMPAVLNGINALQDVPWQVNQPVNDIIREVWSKGLGVDLPSIEPLAVPECPVEKGIKTADMDEEQRADFLAWCNEANAIHSEDKKRVGQCYQTVNIIRTAQNFSKFNEFYFPYHADFRGRIYTASTGFSPQGPNVGKGLLRFRRGKALGSADGEKWFKIYGASKYGFDKLSFDERIKKCEEMTDDICRTARDPLSNREFWANADKPWQFLAWCFEYHDYCSEGRDFVSHLPMAQDGNCNGLQHLSALGRDYVGGKATCLVPDDKPSDIYQLVADRTIERLKEVDDPMATRWLEYGLTRKDVKKPVMTLPYGSTRNNCTKALLSRILETNKDFFGKRKGFAAANWLTPYVWDSIKDIVVSARELMDWMRTAAGIITKAGHPLNWDTHLGFPVSQVRYKMSVQRIRTCVGDNMQISVQSDTNILDGPKQRNGISPNIIHSLDATHMLMTVNAAKAEGINDIAVIHDDYGTHAVDTERFQHIIREQFVKLYGEKNPLEVFKEYQERTYDIELPSIPLKNDLDIKCVLDSPYFFS